MSEASKYNPGAVAMQEMCDSLLSASLEVSRPAACQPGAFCAGSSRGGSLSPPNCRLPLTTSARNWPRCPRPWWSEARRARPPACSRPRTRSPPRWTTCSARRATPIRPISRWPSLSGIREAYLTLTGDREFTGGCFPEFALASSASFPVLVKNAMNKRLAEAWNRYGAAGYDWWKKIATVEHFTVLDQIDWLVLGTIGALPSIDEGAEYTELKIGDNGETSDWTKYGGYVGLTLEAILRDNVRAFKRLPDEVALGGMRNISEQVAAIFTANSGAGPTLSDTGALFNATAVTTKGGHENLLTAALGTDLTAWRAVETAMFRQPMHIANETGLYGTGKPQAIKPKFCLVPLDLKGAADELFLKSWTSNGENLGYGYVQPIVVPEWTDATDWAAAADPNILPGIMLGEIFGLMPQIFLAGSETDPSMFANDESRLKVRQFLTVGIGNWRALHKNNVAG